jgi:hypothetical protein
LLSFAAGPLMRLPFDVVEIARESGLLPLHLLVAVASATLPMVGYAVLAALPVRGLGRPVQRAMLMVSVALTVWFAARSIGASDLPGISLGVTFLLATLAMVGVSWIIIRKPHVPVALTAFQAVGLVILGSLLAFLR